MLLACLDTALGQYGVKYSVTALRGDFRVNRLCVQDVIPLKCSSQDMSELITSPLG